MTELRPQPGNNDKRKVTGSPTLHWERFSFGEQMARFAVYLIIVSAIVMSVRSIEVIPEF